jgi:hypothetical protein
MALNNSYGNIDSTDKELKESLLDVLTDLSPTKTPLFTMLGNSSASQTLHEFVEDSTPRATSSGAVAEGADTSYSALSAPTRKFNFVQAIEESFRVSQIQRRSDNVGGDSFNRFKAKAMKTWKMRAEWSLLKGTGISAASGVGTEMMGMLKVITTNIGTYASGTSLTEDRYNDVLELMYNDVDDDLVVTLANIKVKRTISGFTASNTKNIEASEKKIINRIDVYDSDVASQVQIKSHRDLLTQDPFINFQPKAFKKAMFIAPHFEERAKTSPDSNGVIYGAMTLEYRYEKAASLGNLWVA